jgi:SagB-type dehydrogenase family enzyme
LELDTVGQLLHRVARIKSVLPGVRNGRRTFCWPYPSGGAIHELEYYLAVRACAGLAPGFYHYRGLEHGLTHIGAEAPAPPCWPSAPGGSLESRRRCWW